jgi:mycofactocin precursor
MITLVTLEQVDFPNNLDEMANNIVELELLSTETNELLALTILDELLVEEVSIDGMCGVY